jgi:hypothetical protein
MDGGKRRSETVKLTSPANLDHVIYDLNPTLVPGWRLENDPRIYHTLDGFILDRELRILF